MVQDVSFVYKKSSELLSILKKRGSAIKKKDMDLRNEMNKKLHCHV